MSRKSNYIIEETEVLDFAAEGKCIIKNEGEVIFLNGSNLHPGDKVKVLVRKSKKKYSEGVLLEIISQSPGRISPECKHFGVCGGCKWQHLPYDVQLIQKQKQVFDQLNRLGKISTEKAKDILGSKNTFFYRNKLEFTFSAARWFTELNNEKDIDHRALGFHIPGRFEKVLPVEKCFLQPDPSNAILNYFNEIAKNSDYAFYDHKQHVGFWRTLMIRVSSTGQTMVFIQFAQDQKEYITKVLTDFNAKFPEIYSLNYCINTKRNDSYFDLDIVNFSGKPYIEENMEGLTFRIGVKSFYQTNSHQAYELYKKVREFAQITNEDIVYDLYTGTGTIANFLAKEAKKVVGIEYIEEAIQNAKTNAEINNIENTSFYFGDMSKIFTPEFVEKNQKPDVLITDPPRAGMDKAVIDVILEIKPKKIVYVSCNAATQARDLALLSESYEIDQIQPVDMFPHTFHVENVVSLNLKK